jgi:DNA-binding transcriptional regulator GbsR (MarR family)
MTEQVQDSDFINMGMDQAAFDKLEQDFKKVLEEMVGEKSMDRFRSEYERLHRALRTSHENEKRLFKRCKDMNESIQSNATRVKAAIKLT